MGIFSKGNKEKVIGLLDIGSGSVGFALVIVDLNGNSKILTSKRKQLVYQEKPSFKRFLSSAISVINDVLNDVSKEVKRRPDKIYYYLSSPWYASEVRSIRKSFEKDVLVTKKNFDFLINNEKKIFLDTAVEKYKDYLGDSLGIIEVENMQMRLNGYRTTNPFGKKVQLIELDVFFSIASNEVMKSIENQIDKVYSSVDIVKKTFTASLYKLIRKLYPSEASFLTIDISGEMTDISVVHGKVVVGNAAFPVGRNALIRELSTKLSTVEKDAWSKFSLFFADELTSTENKRVSSALSQFSSEWVSSFMGAYEDVLLQYLVPSKVFLVADTDTVGWFKNQIENSLSEALPNKPQLHVEEISKPNIKKNCVIENSEGADVFLMIEALCLNQMMHTKD